MRICNNIVYILLGSCILIASFNYAVGECANALATDLHFIMVKNLKESVFNVLKEIHDIGKQANVLCPSCLNTEDVKY